MAAGSSESSPPSGSASPSPCPPSSDGARPARRGSTHRTGARWLRSRLLKPAPFDYRAPTSLDEALAVLADAGDEAKVLAGGQSLIPLMALRLAQPAVLVDINGVAELAALERDDGALHVGAAVRHRTMERTDL